MEYPERQWNKSLKKEKKTAGMGNLPSKEDDPVVDGEVQTPQKREERHEISETENPKLGIWKKKRANLNGHLSDLGEQINYLRPNNFHYSSIHRQPTLIEERVQLQLTSGLDPDSGESTQSLINWAWLQWDLAF